MNPMTVDVFISSISAVVAVFSAAIAFYMYKMSKNTLQRYDAEIEFLRKQSRSHTFLEIKEACDDINNKIVEWDLDLTDYDENHNLTQKDKQVIIWILHQINFSVFALTQEDVIESEYISMVRRRSIYNIKKMVESNSKAKSWLISMRGYLRLEADSNRFERHFFDLIDEIASAYQQ